MAVVNLQVGGDAVFRLVHKERLDEPRNFLRGPDEDRSGNDKGPWRLPRAFAINGRNERVCRRSSYCSPHFHISSSTFSNADVAFSNSVRSFKLQVPARWSRSS